MSRAIVVGLVASVAKLTEAVQLEGGSNLTVVKSNCEAALKKQTTQQELVPQMEKFVYERYDNYKGSLERKSWPFKSSQYKYWGLIDVSGFPVYGCMFAKTSDGLKLINAGWFSKERLRSLIAKKIKTPTEPRSLLPPVPLPPRKVEREPVDTDPYGLNRVFSDDPFVLPTPNRFQLRYGLHREYYARERQKTRKDKNRRLDLALFTGDAVRYVEERKQKMGGVGFVKTRR